MKPIQSILILLILSILYSVNSQCNTNQVLNQINVCVKPNYIEGCYQYASDTMCNLCIYNYQLGTDGKCQYQPETNKLCCKSKNIVTGKCQQCQTGLILSNEKCISKPIIGCLQQDSNTGNCTTCAKGYLLQNGSCRKGVDNCASYLTFQDTIVCDKCEDGNSLINNACLPNTILGCKDQVDGVCKDCYDPFFQKDNHCQVPNCQSHNEFGCVACECGFYLTPDRKCNQIAQGCIRYNRGICTDCMANFQLKGGVCDIEGCLKIDGIRCAQCADGYISTQLGCKLKNCLIFKDGLCEVCDQGFHYNEGKCVQSLNVATIVA